MVPQFMNGREALCTTNGQLSMGWLKGIVHRMLWKKACLAPACIVMHLVRNSLNVFPNGAHSTSAPEHPSP